MPMMLGCAASRADGLGRHVDAGERGESYRGAPARGSRPRPPCNAPPAPAAALRADSTDGVRTSTASAPAAAARRAAAIVARVGLAPGSGDQNAVRRHLLPRRRDDTRPLSSSSSSAASPLVPSATMPPRPAAIHSPHVRSDRRSVDLAVLERRRHRWRTDGDSHEGNVQPGRLARSLSRPGTWVSRHCTHGHRSGAGGQNGRGLVGRARRRVLYDYRLPTTNDPITDNRI